MSEQKVSQKCVDCDLDTKCDHHDTNFAKSQLTTSCTEIFRLQVFSSVRQDSGVDRCLLNQKFTITL